MNTRIHNKTFYALDFDRCLADTEQLYASLLKVAEDMKIAQVGDLEAARYQVEETGGSFDIMAHLADKLTAKQLNELATQYLARPAEKDQFLRDGARELLDWLDKNNLDYGIVTYGGTLWQNLKIKRAGLAQAPHFVLDNPDKARLITSWYDELNDAYYLPAALMTRKQYLSVVLIDDKERAFAGIDDTPGTRGYWVRNPGEPVATSQQGSMSENVRTVTSLLEVVNYEQDILT